MKRIEKGIQTRTDNLNAAHHFPLKTVTKIVSYLKTFILQKFDAIPNLSVPYYIVFMF